jgi:hypothetical protein
MAQLVDAEDSRRALVQKRGAGHFAYAYVDSGSSSGSAVGDGILGELGFGWYGVR